ncbi:DUF2480 family protein [Fluviicola sp.]|jgi:hypothetical protein|uniref:DUF2480 family protein n=1 Tax=Fluviicola sp. TaxID=1917219 RepID=UPI002824508F|nr:DUF2480 family protein [Fluviicola sp.]MDR0801340.1 DUF2480 family protein [Fluviicola sp.]
MSEIVNRVKQSGLITVDLADYCPKDSEFLGFDFEPSLWNGLVLKEKDFRDYVKQFDWNQFAGKHVYLYCSADAILPSWAFMLVSSRLVGTAASVSIGTLENAKQKALELQIEKLDVTPFTDGKLIVKGCSDIPQPEAAMSRFLIKVQPVCSSIMYGEACSSVPIYKKPKQK